MPIKIPDKLPAAKTLEQENIFVMKTARAKKQDIRPLKILILNLMPTKIETETQLLRLLSNSPLQVDIELLQTVTHISKNTAREHLLSFYKSFDQIRENKYDGLIVTGAPVELLPFEDVNYWEELCEIFAWSNRNVYSCLHICWAAQARLYYEYGINKQPLKKKLSGVFENRVLDSRNPLMRGFDEVFLAPHSRNTGISADEVKNNPALQLLSVTEKGDPYIITDNQGRQVFVTGHPEYDKDTLKIEYLRDVEKGIDPEIPFRYFSGDDPQTEVIHSWKSHAYLLYSNWLNYYVYQKTPFNLEKLK